MTLPSCTTATATPGTFHCFMAPAARSSRPCSFVAGVAAEFRAVAEAGVDAPDFFAVWAKLGDAKKNADKNTTSAGFRMGFLSVITECFRIRCADRTALRGRADILQCCRKWVLRRSGACDS